MCFTYWYKSRILPVYLCLSIYKCLVCQSSHFAKMFQLYLLWGFDSSPEIWQFYQVELDLAVKEVMLCVCIRQDNFGGPLCRAGQSVPVHFAEYCSSLSACSLTVLRMGTGNVTTAVLTNGSTVQAGQGQAFKCASQSSDVLKGICICQSGLVQTWAFFNLRLKNSSVGFWLCSVVRDSQISAANWRICPMKVLNHPAQRGAGNSWGSWQTCHLGMCTACC